MPKKAVFKFNHSIERFEQAGGKISAAYAGGERFEADAFVCALGSFSRPALAALGAGFAGVSRERLFAHGAGGQRCGRTGVDHYR